VNVHLRDVFAVGLLAMIVMPAVIAIGRGAATVLEPGNQRWSDGRFGSPSGAPLLPWRQGVLAWVTAWVAAQVVAVVVVSASGHSSPLPIPVLGLSLVGSWSVYLVAVWMVSSRVGTGNLRSDFGLRFRVSDVAGLPFGAAIQLVLVPAVYVPLRAAWPATFDDDRLQQNATDLVDRAGGISVVILAVLVVCGAPVIEEIVYRGLLQRSVTSGAGALVGLLVTAAIFTIVHFRPVEYPGLAVFALIVGAVAARTCRLGPPIAIHVGFNATGLALALW